MSDDEGGKLIEQMEELEVLQSIYDGDPEFRCINDHTFQYKFGREGERTTILLEIKWPSDYPCILPIFGVNSFYNNHLSAAVKSAIVTQLTLEAGKEVGTQLTYNIIEWARENLTILIESYLLKDDEASGQTEKNAAAGQLPDDEKESVGEAKAKEKKEQLTKSQKRKEWDKMDSKGEKQRGYDWVDVIKHLSQTGSKPEPTVEAASTLSTPTDN